MKKTAIFYCGHLSKFGVATFEALLNSEEIEIRRVVLADVHRWEIFRSALSGEKVIFERPSLRKYEREVKAIKQKLPKNASLKIIHDAVKEDMGCSEFNLTISSAYPQIFDKRFLSKSTLTVNFHPSYLPRCRGAHPVYWTIAAGEEFSGVSCHKMTENLDAGDIISRIKIPLDEDIRYRELYSKINSKIPEIISGLDSFLRSEVSSFPQEDDASFFRNNRKYHMKIYWSRENSILINRKIRAGGSYCFGLNGTRYKPLSCRILEQKNFITNSYDQRIEPGTIVSITNQTLIVKTLDGLIEIRVNHVQNRFRKIMRYLGYPKLYDLQVGSVLI